MFLAPLFLLGLVAIGVPLWLHRVARANPVQHTFPSVMLLEAAETQRTARRQIRYWLLLMLRILLLAALALAFAGPLWKAEQSVSLDANVQLHAIVLDSSLSMRHGERWARAIEAAESILQSLRGSDRVMLIRAAGRRMEIAHDAVPAREAGALRAALRNLSPGIERVDFGFAMSTAEQWLRSPRPPVLLHFISDFQQSGAPLRFADLEPPANSQLIVHDVGSADRGNVYIDEVTIDADRTHAIEAHLASTHHESVQRDVVLQIDGKEVARRRANLSSWRGTGIADTGLLGEGGGMSLRGRSADKARQADALPQPRVEKVSVQFGELTLAPGAHRVEVRLQPEDELPQDDRFFAVLEHSEPRALLLTESAESDDGAYFAAAIGALTAPRVSVDRELAGSFGERNFGDYAALVVPDIFALSSAAAAQVEDYVAAGGALLTTLGSGGRNAQHALLQDWRISAPRAQAATIGAIDESHPILRHTREWHRVRLFRQRPVQAPAADRVLIAHADGAPLLIERSLGAGRMLILTAPIDRDWNDLAIHPVFVQFISQATHYLIGHDNALSNVTVGSAVMTGLTRLSGGQIFDPSGARVLDLASTANADRLVPEALGFYEIRHANGARWLAVNTDRRESDLRRLEPDYVARWQAMRRQDAELAALAEAETPVQPARSIGPFVLWVAALLLLAELLMANRYLAVRREVAR